MLWVACDVAEGEPAASRDIDDAEVTAVETEVAPEVSEPGTVEKVIDGDAGADDLFPDLSGDDLVWVKVRLDTSVGSADTDCTSCPYCAGCRFELRHRRLPDGPATLLMSQPQPTARPRVRDGIAAWVDASSVVHVRDLDSGAMYQSTSRSWISATPVPYGGKVWWWGYDSVAGYGLISFDYTRGVITAEHEVYVFDPNVAPGNLSNVARDQPFSIDAHGVVYASNDARALLRWAFAGEPELLVETTAPAPRLLRGFTRGDGNVVVVSDDGDAHLSSGDVTLSETPSRYVAPVVDGDRVLWLDFRDGAYGVFGARGVDIVRLTSDKAVVGAISSIAASDGRVVWADHRSGQWRLVTRTW